MKQAHGWWLPDHEQHLIAWMSHPKNVTQVLDGRVMYQAVKQRAAMEACTSFRTAVDVGGHVGLWSYYLARRFARVHAFEPVEEHRQCFAKNINGSGSVTLHACALGSQNGSISINTTRSSSGDSWVNGDGDIPMRTLDDFDLPDVDFMKLDCEGYELHALHGAVETLKRCRPVVIVEQKPNRAQKFGLTERGAVGYLESLGYRLAREISGDFILVPQ